MAIPQSLSSIACHWIGTNRLQDPGRIPATDSASTAVVTPVLRGRFLRFDYTWAYRGEPQEGSILIGTDASGTISAHWIDTWHMGDLVMGCRGTAGSDGVVSIRGSYAAPPGPDWGWRIDLSSNANRLRMVMFNISPDGREGLAVEADYTRA